jgi:hypothetical protein
VSQRGRDGRGSYCRPCMNVRSLKSRHKTRAAAGRPVKPRRVVPRGHRWCPDCEVVKPFEEFPHNKSGRAGRGRYCLPCHNVRSRANRIKNHGSTREYRLKARYGIGQVDVDRMLADQGGLCLGCDKPDPEHVDHDHETGNVRGMLCFNCNQALGNVRDKMAVLSRLRDYLAVSKLPESEVVYQEYRVRGRQYEYVDELRHCG